MNFPFLSRSVQRLDRTPSGKPQDIGSEAYLAMRCEEECYRAHRYGRPLALVVAEPTSSGAADEERLKNWLRASVRMSDIVAYLEDGTYALLLPETGRSQAEGLMNRLCVAFPGLKAGIANFPEDGTGLDALVRAARERA